MKEMRTRKRMRQDKVEKKSKKWLKYLYLLTCFTCVTGAWTSARFISEIEGVTDSARTAKLSYEITNQLYKINASSGEETTLGEPLQDFNYSENPNANQNVINKYLIDTSKGDKPQFKIEFKIKLASEVTTRFIMMHEVRTELPLIVNKAELSNVPGKGTITATAVGNGEQAKYELFNEVIQPTSEIIMTCTIYVDYPDEGAYGGKYDVQYSETEGWWRNDKYTNFYPSIEQVD